MSAAAMRIARFAGSILLAAVLAGCSDPQTPDPSRRIEPGVHPEGWATPGSPEFHGHYLAATGYNLGECRNCHGNDYSGGLVGVSCRDCHTSTTGPEACNTCHGNSTADASDLRNAAPPRGLRDETILNQPAVGAHPQHLGYFTSRPVVQVCQECHRVPADLRSPGHLDPPGDQAGGTADVIFADSLAALRTEGGARIPSPVYDRATYGCSGTYCHGNWGLLKTQAVYDFEFAADRMEGNSASPVWTDPAAAACGTCHGLPPTGHAPESRADCGTCHDGVVNAAGGIADSTLHINGRINVFGEEYPMGQ